MAVKTTTKHQCRRSIGSNTASEAGRFISYFLPAAVRRMWFDHDFFKTKKKLADRPITANKKTVWGNCLVNVPTAVVVNPFSSSFGRRRRELNAFLKSCISASLLFLTTIIASASIVTALLIYDSISLPKMKSQNHANSMTPQICHLSTIHNRRSMSGTSRTNFFTFTFGTAVGHFIRRLVQSTQWTVSTAGFRHGLPRLPKPNRHTLSCHRTDKITAVSKLSRIRLFLSYSYGFIFITFMYCCVRELEVHIAKWLYNYDMVLQVARSWPVMSEWTIPARNSSVTGFPLAVGGVDTCGFFCMTVVCSPYHRFGLSSHILDYSLRAALSVAGNLYGVFKQVYRIDGNSDRGQYFETEALIYLLHELCQNRKHIIHFKRNIVITSISLLISNREVAAF